MPRKGQIPWNKNKTAKDDERILSGKNHPKPWLNKNLSKEHKDKIKKGNTGKRHNYKGGINHGHGYISILVNPKTKKYIKEEKLIAEKILERYLKKGEIIHHINEIKTDNRPENLYLYPGHKEHTAYHNLKCKPILKSNLYELKKSQ